jgi:hypothetical protein
LKWKAEHRGQTVLGSFSLGPGKAGQQKDFRKCLLPRNRP